ncbi:protein kinase [Actinomadura sp. 1N219]|uniref:serine/threonine-protein kinase n=1 Tax=Actinomadura sp. 1N219 TaxID=3375152 RepID=UPI0037895278
MAAPLVSGDPRQLGAYWLAGRVGEGSYGVVFEGYDPSGARVAVKMLKGDATAEALRELRMLIRVDQSCTARVIAADFDHSPAYVVSEFIAGPDLKSWIQRNGPYEPAAVRRLALDLVRALAPIHKVGITHRDLKPANILLEPDGPKVIDFGLARAHDMTLSANQVKGTPLYMAPEVWQNAPATPAADVWAWGAVVLFAATGSDAFRGGSVYAVRHRVISADPSFEALAEPLRSLVAQALSKDPDQRPTAAELLDALTEDAPRAGTPEPELLPPEAVVQSAAQRAESAYAGLSDDEQAVVPRILLRMVTGSTDPDKALRTARFEEFRDGAVQDDDADVQAIQRVLDRLRDVGAVVKDGDGYTLSSPALLRGWSRLGAWVEEDRAVLGLHRDLAVAARNWDEHGRKRSDLLRGSPLDLAVQQAVAVQHHLKLNPLEQDFYVRSVAAVHRRGRVRAAVTMTLMILLVSTITALVIVIVQSGKVAEQRDQAVSSRVALLADSLRRDDPGTAKQLAIAAGALAPGGQEARNTLATVYNQWEQYNYTPPGADGTNSRADSDRTGHLVAYSSGDKVNIVDVDARRVRRSITVGGPPLGTGGSVVLSGNGRTLMLGRKDGTVSIVDTDTGRQRPVTIRPEVTYGLELSPTGAWLLDARQERAIVWDTRSGRRVLSVKRTTDNSNFRTAAFTSDEKRLITAQGSALEFWDLGTGRKVSRHERFLEKGLADPKEIKAAATTQISDVGVSPDGRFLSLRQSDRLWIVEAAGVDRPHVQRWRKIPAHEVTEAQFSLDGERVSIGATVWQTEGPEPEPILTHSNECLRYNPVGQDERTLRCIDTGGAVNVLSLGALTDPIKLGEYITDEALSADGSTLAFVHIVAGASVQIWDPVKRTKKSALPITDIAASARIILSDDGRLLANVRRTGEIEVWNVTDRRRKAVLTTKTELGHDTPVAFSPDGRTLAVWKARDLNTTIIELWDVPTGKLRAASPGRTRPALEPVHSYIPTDAEILFTRDNRRIIAGADQGVIDARTGKRLVEPSSDMIAGLALSGDGLLAAEENSKISLWDGSTLTRRHDLGKTTATAFSPDGRLLAGSDGQGTIRLWDHANRRPFGPPLTGRKAPYSTGAIETLAFAPDGSSILAVDDAGYLRAHLIDPARIKTELCKSFGPLSKANWKKHIPEVPYRRTC